MNAIQRAVLGVVFGLLVTNSAQAGEVKGKVATTGLKSAGNIVIYIDAIAGKKFDVPTEHPAVDQRNLAFVPHVSVIVRGTTVDFMNGDNVAHNVYWPSISGDKKLRHSMTIVSPGQHKSFQFENVGVAQLLCNLHSDMVAYVVVAPTPYFSLTGNDGSFNIKSVPSGTYTLKTWSENGKPATRAITVTDATTTVDLTVTK